MNRPSRPLATYRIQFHRSFGFREAQSIVAYLERLGVTHLYVSPVLRAREGSGHGYDVIDPTCLNPELGPPGRLHDLASDLRRRGMGILLDIVPNHMATDADNPSWWDVLEHGRESSFRAWYDVRFDEDQEGRDRIVLPVLGSTLAEALESEALRADRDERGFCVRYHDQRFPLNVAGLGSLPESPDELRGDRLARLLAAQAYRLEHWKTAIGRINYRRFFDINHLIGVRVEDPVVLEATHERVFRMVRDGILDGLRIDHIDGLADPRGYLEAVQRLLGPPPRSRGFWIVVEKILTGGERLRADWPVHGTTGYDFLRAVSGVFVDSGGFADLEAGYRRFAGVDRGFADVADDAKRQVARDLFAAEFGRLASILETIASRDPRGDGLDGRTLHDAVVEVTVALPVYRTYLGADGPSSEDEAVIDRAVRTALTRCTARTRPAVELFRDVLLRRYGPSDSQDREQRTLLVTGWQQLSGPVMAKGVEDTALYRFYPLLGLNEVGVEPAVEADPVSAFHRHNAHARRHWPRSLLATSTHDTKRGEDARARLFVLSETSREWNERLEAWKLRNLAKKRRVGDHDAPDANEEALVYQTLLGMWPSDGGEPPDLRERARAFLVKAAREAKSHTSWLRPDLDHERALGEFLDAILSDREFVSDFLELWRRVAWHGALNSLSQTLLKIASPGVPDVYQGSELWDLSLVDPDNRRPVDYRLRARLLEELDRTELSGDAFAQMLSRWTDGRIKLFVLSRALRDRRERPVVFVRGAYLPVLVRGDRREHVCAFARRAGRSWALAVAPRLTTGLAGAPRPPTGRDVWEDDGLVLPAGAPDRWVDALSGGRVSAVPAGTDRVLPLRDVFARLPVALLREDESKR